MANAAQVLPRTAGCEYRQVLTAAVAGARAWAVHIGARSERRPSIIQPPLLQPPPLFLVLHAYRNS